MGKLIIGIVTFFITYSQKIQCCTLQLCILINTCTILYSIEAGVAAALFLLVVCYFPAKPPKPPSVTANIQRVEFLSGLKKCAM